MKFVETHLQVDEKISHRALTVEETNKYNTILNPPNPKESIVIANRWKDTDSRLLSLLEARMRIAIRNFSILPRLLEPNNSLVYRSSCERHCFSQRWKFSGTTRSGQIFTQQNNYERREASRSEESRGENVGKGTRCYANGLEKGPGPGSSWGLSSDIV